MGKCCALRPSEARFQQHTLLEGLSSISASIQSVLFIAAFVWEGAWNRPAPSRGRGLRGDRGGVLPQFRDGLTTSADVRPFPLPQVVVCPITSTSQTINIADARVYGSALDAMFGRGSARNLAASEGRVSGPDGALVGTCSTFSAPAGYEAPEALATMLIHGFAPIDEWRMVMLGLRYPGAEERDTTWTYVATSTPSFVSYSAQRITTDSGPRYAYPMSVERGSTRKAEAEGEFSIYITLSTTIVSQSSSSRTGWWFGSMAVLGGYIACFEFAVGCAAFLIWTLYHSFNRCATLSRDAEYAGHMNLDGRKHDRWRWSDGNSGRQLGSRPSFTQNQGVVLSGNQGLPPPPPPPQPMAAPAPSGIPSYYSGHGVPDFNPTVAGVPLETRPAASILQGSVRGVTGSVREVGYRPDLAVVSAPSPQSLRDSVSLRGSMASKSMNYTQFSGRF
eukprot:tig00001155_g7309.t1